ncbi:hypothetical protein ACQJBY_023836 [Aegilops geniculata]
MVDEGGARLRQGHTPPSGFLLADGNGHWAGQDRTWFDFLDQSAKKRSLLQQFTILNCQEESKRKLVRRNGKGSHSWRKLKTKCDFPDLKFLKVYESGCTTRLKGRHNKSTTGFLPSHRRLDFMREDVEALNEKLRERKREKGRHCLP